MESSFQSTFNYKVIYAFTIHDKAHAGKIKIGDTTLQTQTPVEQLVPNSDELQQAALMRIHSYTNTAGITPVLLYTELAVRKSVKGRLRAFRDHQVHAVLENSGFHHVRIGKSTGKEWYRVDVQTVKKAIAAVKHNYANLSHTDIVQRQPIEFRPEQEACIQKVVQHFKKAERFLINAKMRYGKTFVALEIIKRCQFDKTIILTHRPVVDAGWYDDFTKIFYGRDDYIYGSKANGYSVEQLLTLKKHFVYFASIQDLRGSEQVGGKFAKNDTVFQTVWDCVIVDEAHEGTQTALGEETVKAVYKENLHRTKFIALSGTPFNILADYDEDSIYTWDYLMEQESKAQWDKLHFGDSNPYEELPELRIYTYSLADILQHSRYQEIEDKAFNFREFFRTFTGNPQIDKTIMPADAKIGDFVHEADVWSFLNLLVKDDENSNYPYATKEYRSLFRHSLWMVPGVREAKALKELMLKHPAFGNGTFHIVNVAGDGDEEEPYDEALQKVRYAIAEAQKDDSYTITLSCGKLTTGVTVKEWTAVFMLAGSYSTSAASYLQTIFRVQSPCNTAGKIKDRAYVFDFAPDRALRMVATAVQVSTRAGKSKQGDKVVLGKFLNYCPVIAVNGSAMKPYSAARMMQQLKRAYAERVVRNGFDDMNLYNDELLDLDNLEIAKFNKLKGIIGTTKAAPKMRDIPVNQEGLSQEEYEEQKKPGAKKKLTPAEKRRLEALRKKNNARKNAISILRGISIRMPLLIYGADIPYEEDISLKDFVEIVDDVSWKEFMPPGVSKRLFKSFMKYYDEEVFLAAGRRIRDITWAADAMEPLERIKRIAGLFRHFRNPDKETVLTPWRVVNRHLSDCIGGYCFYDDDFTEDEALEQPRFVTRGSVTEDIFGSNDAKILEINSKTGLYPLYVAYTLYRKKLAFYQHEQMTLAEKQKLWQAVIQQNIFVLCKTPMARAITKRTLAGYAKMDVNANYFRNLIETLKSKLESFRKRISRVSYWQKGTGKMKFDAIVGNPPYMRMDGGHNASAVPIYQDFVMQAMQMNAKYVSMIMPSRWFAGGRGLEHFREFMRENTHIQKLYDYADSKEIFPEADISGGICYFLYSSKYDGPCEMVNVDNGHADMQKRYLNEFPIIVRSNAAISILHKVLQEKEGTVSDSVSPMRPFGLRTYEKPDETGNLILRWNKGKGKIEENRITAGKEYINKWKVISSRVFFEHAGQADKNGQYRVLSILEILAPKEVCTETYVIIDSFDTQAEAENMLNYLRTKFARFLILQACSSIMVNKASYIFLPKQDFSRSWTDEDLYDKYGLDLVERSLIESTIKPMPARE